MALVKEGNSLKKLLLFDIDGTLIASGGAGEAALKDAAKERFGVDEDFSGITIAGATDSGIAHKLLHKHGLPETAENISALFDSYLQHLATRLPKHNGRLLPGIIELLQKLKQRPDCIVALLTGNLERGARIKLTHYGVWDFFEFGAFADDHRNRNELGKFAKVRAFEKHGVEFPSEQIYILGDTPKDIECGKAIGAKTVAIATGSYNREELAAHQPDFLLDDLSDVDAVIESLLGK
ncbi:MAG: HAD family hydrolase [Chthoniobacterales bacterium]